MIEINEYESLLYTGPGPMIQTTVLIARGTINDERYDYVRFDEETQPGVLPAWFIKDAELGFARRELANMEKQNANMEKQND